MKLIPGFSQRISAGSIASNRFVFYHEERQETLRENRKEI